MLTATIRRAEPADALALADIGRRTFCETFGHLYPRQDLERFLDEAYGAAAISRFLADPAFAAWLVEIDGRPVGHGLAGPCHLPHCEVTAACGEVKRLYLRDGVRGFGLGDQLLRTILNWLEREGPRQVWLGVWSENHGAQRFYRRFGFQSAGRYEFPVGSIRDQEIILRRPLGEPLG